MGHIFASPRFFIAKTNSYIFGGVFVVFLLFLFVFVFILFYHMNGSPLTELSFIFNNFQEILYLKHYLDLKDAKK